MSSLMTFLLGVMVGAGVHLSILAPMSSLMTFLLGVIVGVHLSILAACWVAGWPDKLNR